MSQPVQTLLIIGEPIPCDRTGCEEPAAIYLREQEADGGEAFGICYCEQHWQAARRAFAPLTAHDVAEAVREAATITTEGP